MSTIRVALVTNALGPPVRGNGTTVHRWLGWLPDVDVHVTPIGAGFDLPHGSRPDLVHGYHALHGGRHAQRLAQQHDLPLVISLGGTDLRALREGSEEEADTRDVLTAAALVTGAFASFEPVLRDRLDASPPYAVVPRGVHVPDTPPPTPRGDRLRVFLPAGIRPVKDPVAAAQLAAALRKRGVPLSLLIAGPVLDASYEETFRDVLRTLGDAAGIDWWDAVPRTDMPNLYGLADVVWNTSLHEGGPNALLEALAHGCAVCARDVPGNRDLLGDDGAPGVLFRWNGELHDLDPLVAWHESIRTETPDARAERVAAARAWLRHHHDSLAEVRALRAAYERVLD